MINIYRKILNGFIVICTIVMCFIGIHAVALASEQSVADAPENIEFFDIAIEDLAEGNSLREASISGIAINSDTGDRVFGLFEFQNGDTVVSNDETEHIYTVIFTPWDSSQQYIVGDYKLNVVPLLFEESIEPLSSAASAAIPYTGVEDNCLCIIIASLVVMLITVKKPKFRFRSKVRLLFHKKILPALLALVTAFSTVLSASPIAVADSVEGIAPQSDDETAIRLIFGNQEKYLSCATLTDAIAKVRQENILGLASQFNIFCHNDMTVYAADSEGRIATGCGPYCDVDFGDFDSDTPSSYGWYKIGNGHYVNDSFSIPFYGDVNLIDQVGGLSLISGGDVYNVSSAVSGQIYSDLIDFDDEFEFLKLRSKQLTADGKNIPTYFMFDDGSFLDKNALSAKHIIDGVTYLAKEYTGIYYTTDTNGNLLQNNHVVAQAGEDYHIADNKFLQSRRVGDKYIVCELMPEDSFKYVVYCSHNGSNCYVAHGFSSGLTEEQPVYINISKAIVDAKFGGDYTKLIGGNTYYFMSERNEPSVGYEVVPSSSEAFNNAQANGEVIKNFGDCSIISKEWNYANIVVNIEGDYEPNVDEGKNLLHSSTRIVDIDLAPVNTSDMLPSDSDMGVEYVTRDDDFGNLNNRYGCNFVLYHLPDITTVCFDGDFSGTVFAPNAYITDCVLLSDNYEWEEYVYNCPGHISGSVVCNGIDSAMEFGYRSFTMRLSESIGDNINIHLNLIPPTLIKLNSKNNCPMVGVTFRLYDDTNNEIAMGVTDKSGRLVFKSEDRDLVLPAGRYVIRESSVPDGFSNSYDSIQLSVENESCLMSDGGIFTKSSFTCGSKTFDTADIFHSNYLINDNTVMFKLSDSNTDQLIPYGEDVVSYLPCDMNESGVITQTVTLTDGVYELKYHPIVDAAGNLIKNSYAVSCKDSSDKAVQIAIDYHPDDVTVYNTPESTYEKFINLAMTFSLTKLNSKTKSPISGVQFELYDSTNNLLGKGTTDTKGELLFKTLEGKVLYLAEGSYKLKEVNIPAGYSKHTSVTDFVIEKGDTEYHNNGLISCNVYKVAGSDKFDIDMTDLLNNEYLIEDNIITFISDGKDGYTPQGSSIESFQQYTNSSDEHSGTLYYKITFNGGVTADIKCIPIKDENGDKMTGKYVVANCSSSGPEIDVIYHINDFVVENIPLEPAQMGLAVEASGISKLNSFDNKPIKNVQFELYSNADILLGIGTSDVNGHVTFTSDGKPVLLSEGSYKIKEIGTPTGYINTNPITEFTVNKGTPLSYNDGVVTVETYEMKDGNKLGVDNIFDLVNNEYLVGDDTVTFKIEENGLTPKFSGKASNVKSSIDDDGIITQTIIFTEDNCQYTMTYYPIKGEDGQVISGNYAVLCTNEEGTAIQVNAKCGIKDVVIYNEPEDKSTTMGLTINGFGIIKRDSSNNKPLEGITFEIQDNDHNIVASGATDADGKIAFLQSLAEGTYTINETNTPDGYALRDPLTFTVKKNIQAYNNGKVTCEMFEVEDKTSLNIDVFDITQNEYLMAETAIKFVPDGNKYIPTAVDPTVNITVQSTAIDNNTGVIVNSRYSL